MKPPVPLDNPIAAPGGFVLRLFCDHFYEGHTIREFPHVFRGPDKASVRKQAKALGWKLHHDRTATCPKCVRALKRTK